MQNLKIAYTYWWRCVDMGIQEIQAKEQRAYHGPRPRPRSPIDSEGEGGDA